MLISRRPSLRHGARCLSWYDSMGKQQASSQSELQAQGTAAFKKKDHRGAVDSYTRALAAWSETAQLYSNRAAAHFALKEYEEALCDAHACVRLDPKWSKGHGRRGNALQGLHRYEEARRSYETALELDPGNSARLPVATQDSHIC